MVRRNEPEATDRDERLGEAVEAYLALIESGSAPDPDAFAGHHPEIRDDLLAALEGLALVQGLVGESGSSGQGPATRLESGRRIAGYKIVRELGRGGMGVVYEAVHVALDRPVALKVLATQAAPDSSGRRRFLNEARTAAGLHHTHIVPVFDVGQVGGLCYYAMQRIEGSGLDRLIRHLRRDRTTAAGTGSAPGLISPFSLLGRVGGAATPFPFWGHSNGRGSKVHGHGDDGSQAATTTDTGPWPAATVHGSLSRSSSAAAVLSGAALSADGVAVAAAARLDCDDEAPPFEPPRGSAYYRWVAEVGRQAAEALAHAHRRGVIHRDVKPSNLLADGRGVIWVADFGLARRMADPAYSHHETLIGTPRYMSPEQAHVGPVDGRSDLYSLGATLFELLTLRPPFEGRSAAELIEQIGHNDPPSPRQFDARIPRDLEMIVLKLLAKRPDERYATATDLADDLRRFLSLEPVRARRISPLGRLWRFAQRRPGITAVSTTAAVTVLAVSLYAHLSVLNALGKANVARAATEAAMRTELWRESSVVRLSNMPNRRVTGLGLIGKAAGMKPEPDLLGKLRSEALEFLVLRDVEARPGVPTGRARAIAYGPDGTRLAVLAAGDNGDTFDLWDLARQERLSSRPLRNGRTAAPAAPQPSPASAAPAPNAEAKAAPPAKADGAPPTRSPSPPTLKGQAPPGPGPGGGPPPGRGGGSGGLRGWGWFGQSMAAAGPSMVVIAPDGQGLRLFDAVTGARIDELRLPGHIIRGVHAAIDGQRLVTVETLFTPRRGEVRPERSNRSTQAPGGTAAGPTPTTPRVPAMGLAERYRINLWDPDNSAQPLATLVTFDADTNGWTMPPLVAVSPDGRTVATAQFRGTSVSLWSAQTGKALGQIETVVELSALALGPDDQLAVAGNGEIRLWEVGSRTPLPSLATNQVVARMLLFSPRGSLLAVLGMTGREIELWDTAAHALVAVLPTADPVHDLAFAPDGRTLAAAPDSRGPAPLTAAAVGGGQANLPTPTTPTTSVWAVVEGEVRTRLGGFDALTRSMAFRSDGLLALGSFKGTIRFWNAGRCVNAASAPGSGSSPEGSGQSTTVAAPSAATDEAAGRERPVALTFDDRGHLVTLDPDALRIVENPPHGTVSTRAVLPEGAEPPGRMMGRVVLGTSGNGRILAVGRGGQVFLWRSGEPGTLRPITPPLDLAPTYYRARSRDRGGPSRGRPGFGPPPMPQSWNALAVAPAGDRLYLVDNTGDVHAWAIEGSGPAARSLSWSGLLANKAVSLALSDDGTLLACGGYDGSVTVVYTATGGIRARLLPGAESADVGWIWSLAFAPGARELAVGTQQGHIELWSLANPTTPMLRLPGHRGFVAALAFDPQGLRLASAGSDRTVDVWNLERLRNEFTQLGLAW